MKPEEIAVLSLIISGAFTLLTNIVIRVLSRRIDKAGIRAQEADAAEHLSLAAKTQVETYVNSIVKPLEAEMLELRTANNSLKKELDDERDRNRKMSALLQDEIEHIKAEVRKADDALEFLIGATRKSYPEEVETAYKIRNGTLHL